MKAVVLHEPGSPPRVEEVELDPPGRCEVLVRVAAAGVCHSDLHLADGHLGAERFPIVPGHEGAGVVEAVGPEVDGPAPGDRVAFCFVPSCRTCRACRAGRFNLCETAAIHSWRGTLLDGSSRLHLGDGRPLSHFNFISCFAERCVVPAPSAVVIPPQLPLWEAAMVGCAVVTGVGAVRNAAGVAAGESVCVIGCGGIGQQIVAAARLAGATPIIAVERDEAKRELARSRGATHAVDPIAGDPVDRVLALSEGGVEHAFEAIGTPATIRQAWDVLRPGATAVVVGVAPQGVEVALPAFDLLSEKSLKGCYYGSANPGVELSRLARLVSEGSLPVADVVSDMGDLSCVGEAFQRLRRGEGARTVIVLDRELAGAPPAVGPLTPVGRG
jgi:S-(hydroxymethyl)glutathione dehydrogenase / alcohol dehydrogenase